MDHNVIPNGGFLQCASCICAAQVWCQVTQHMHNPNVIFDALSVSKLAPTLVASIGVHESLQILAFSSSHYNHK